MLVENVGNLLEQLGLGKSDWYAFEDDIQPRLWFARRNISAPMDMPIVFLLEAI
jgi:hypothetical protein